MLLGGEFLATSLRNCSTRVSMHLALAEIVPATGKLPEGGIGKGGHPFYWVGRTS